MESLELRRNSLEPSRNGEGRAGPACFGLPARVALWSALAAGLLGLPACSRAGKETAKQGTAWAYDREFRANPAVPVSLALRLDRVECKLSDRVALEQELRVGPGFDAEFPEYLPEDFEGFSVTEIQREGASDSAVVSEKPDAEPKVAKKRLILEPDRSGELVIAPLAVYYRRSGEPEESFFLTDEIRVTVQALGGLESLEPRPAKSIYEAPPLEGGRGLPAWALAAGGAAAIACPAVAYLLLRARRPAPPTPPHEIAWEALRRLVGMQLLEREEIEKFFVILSAILRDYIERRFGVHAPERTTEEFLDEAARHASLANYRARLGQFLSLSDRVKFARYRPDDEAIQGAFDAAKQFIAETTPAEEALSHAR